MKNNIFPTPVSNLEPNSNSESFWLSDVSEGYDSLGETATAGHKLHLPNKEASL